MKLEIKNCFGIKNKIIFDAKDKDVTKKNLIIFGPNGVGKTSISKGFNQLNDGIIENFGQENDGNHNSLIIDGLNMEQLINQNKKILIISEDKLLDKFEEPIQRYIEDNYELKSLKEIYKQWQHLAEKILKEYEENIGTNSLINEGISETLFSLAGKITDKNAEKFIQKVQQLFDNGNKNTIIENKDKLIVLKEDFSILKKVKLIFKNNGKIKFNEIYNIFTNNNISIKNGYDNTLGKAWPIIEKIKNEGLGEKFGYKLNEEFEEILKIYNKIENDIIEKGLSQDDARLFIKSIPSFSRCNIKVEKEKFLLPAVEKKIIDEIKIKEEHYISDLFNNNNEFLDGKEKFDEAANEYIKTYNKIVKKINLFLNFRDSLIWNIVIEEKKSIAEDFKLNVYMNNVIYSEKTFMDFSSSGQKRIALFSLALLNWKNYDYIVMDDIFSSMDYDHSDILVEMIKKITKPFIFLTHNFLILNKFILSGKFEKETSLFFLDMVNDNNNENKSLVIKIEDWEHVKKISTLLNENVSYNELEISKISMISTVLHEYIINYIFINKNTGLPNDNQKYFDKILNLINSSARHWKGNENKVNAYLNDLFNGEHKINEIFLGEKSVFNQLKKRVLAKEDFNEYFIKKEINFEVINTNISLIDLITFKYFVSMKIRQLIEESILKENNLLEKFWNDNKILESLCNYKPSKIMFDEEFAFGNPNSYKFEIYKKEIKDIYKNENNKKLLVLLKKMNFLNHLDNLKWIPIFEFPTIKLIKYLELTKKIIQGKVIIN